MRPATAKPFLFEQSFDEEAMQRARERKRHEREEAARAAELAEQNQTPPPPTFTEEELQAAKAAAWQEGHQAGVADTQKQQEAQTLDLLENLSAQISGMHVHQDLANERIAAEMTEFSLEVCRRILPDFVDSHGGEELRVLLAECLEKITPASRILITVSPDSLGLLEPQVDVLAARSGFEGRIKLVADPTLGPTDLVAVWDGGGMHRIEKDIWQAIEAVVERTQAAAPPMPDLPPEEPETSAPDMAENAQTPEPETREPETPEPKTHEPTAATETQEMSQPENDRAAVDETSAPINEQGADGIAETAVSEEDQNV
ncbi:hypothetical protein EOI86_04375 [Hwanghaeella grinnelliae]|uniref:Uncharacterized protein n=1 Tax=Hwanghaeella grinnelliae TaxID=2500179 RepID=A0A3S2VPG5_9PROT|nr:FliH/SctL family protein [Hwanghaeella grinnelliae]RVU38526.1 hypothetical protein EOI86_04375 [Hwanghaeella grinnelliae]